MKHRKKFSPGEQQEHTAAQRTTPETTEFQTPEDLLRYDAQRTVVPVAVESRLAESAAGLPRPPRSWWRRLFGK